MTTSSKTNMNEDLLIEKLLDWIFEEYCRDDIDFLDNTHRPYVKKKLKSILETAITKAREDERERIIIFLILGSITTVGYWYYNTFMEYGAFGISGIYPCVYDNKTEIIICSVKEK